MRNQAESIIHDTEKNIVDFKDQLSTDDVCNRINRCFACTHSCQVAGIEEKIKDLRAHLSSDASKEDAESTRTKMNDLQQATLKVFEVAYKKVRHSCYFINLNNRPGSQRAAENDAKSAGSEKKE